MQQRILEFVQGLRRSGIPVTVAEAMDAVGILEHIPLCDKALFQDGLRTSLVKLRAHHREFDRLFPLYFSHLERDPHGPGEGNLARIIPIPQIDSALEEVAPSATALGQAIMGGAGVALERMALGAAQAIGLADIQIHLQAGFYGRRMMDRFDWNGLEREMSETLQALRQRGYTDEEIARLRELFQHNREAFRRMLRRLVERELQKKLVPVRERLLAESLEGKSFGSLSEHEIRQMREVVARLVQRLRTKVALLEKRRRRGRLDIRRTLRRNLQYGGTPMELAFREKRRKKTQVMALCDVSSSVWTASRFMLNLLYAIQDQFAKVRSFVFVSDLGEVTEFFSRYETNEAIGKALKEAGIRYYSYTDYGDVFLRFREDYMGDVNSRTVIIIIGDGRNNHLPSQAWVLEAMKERARELIWLNPEPRSTWGLGDSVMPEYVVHCTRVQECRNLRQLTAFIDGLVM